MASRITERRQRQGLKQAELARLAGVDKGAVCRIESGARPAYETAVRLAGVLGCEVCDLWPNAALRGIIHVTGKAVTP